jgi:hypothetical protein
MKLWFFLFAILGVQALLVTWTVHRESLTFDEGDHMFAGYMMGHAHDYGLNPEHPPLAKLLASLPLYGRNLWIPPAHDRDFKAEAYLNGRDWLARNDGDSQRMVFAMRLSVGTLALALTVLVFALTREFFGDLAACLAALLLLFEPNILAHSALVTTDMGVTLFFLASAYCFYRYMRQPTWPRLLLTGLAVGLVLATKHSGFLIAPMLLALAAFEWLIAAREEKKRQALRFCVAIPVVIAVSLLVLWSFYGFRYAARPAGLKLSTTIEEYVAPLSHFSASAVLLAAHHHLLPESYLIGLVDVKRMAEFYPTFVLGRQYAHGVWWYFPLVLLIKSTLGIMILLALTAFAGVAQRLRRGREVVYLLVPGGIYLLVAMLSGMNIGARHILILFVISAILAGAGAAALIQTETRRPRWMQAAIALLIAAHIVSSLSVFPNTMAYANEAWGGAKNVHNLLSDSNADWAQQLLSVRKWQDRHPGQECWFAYFANPEIDPAVYGIRCHKLPTADTYWMGGSDVIPPGVNGYVLLSAGDLSGCEWPSMTLNPYRGFLTLPPEEMIDYGVMVYHGAFSMRQAAAFSRAIRSYELLRNQHPQEALAMAREAVSIDPAEIISLTALGDIAAAQGLKPEARQAWQSALLNAQHLEADAQPGYIPDLKAKLGKL